MFSKKFSSDLNNMQVIFFSNKQLKIISFNLLNISLFGCNILDTKCYLF